MVEFINEPFDEEERQLMAAAEDESAGDPRLPEAEERRLKGALRDAARVVSIRIRGEDLRGIREMAAAAGMPYQTLINSVIHRYVTGGLVPKKAI